MKLVIKNGRVMDPASGRDEVTNIWVEDEKIIGSDSSNGNGFGNDELSGFCRGGIGGSASSLGRHSHDRSYT